MKPKRRKPSGAIYRNFRAVDRRIDLEVSTRLLQEAKIRASIFDLEKRETEARLAVERGCGRQLALQDRRWTDLQQRLAEAEQLIATLADRFNANPWRPRDSDVPFGMTKHLHPSDQKCMICVTEALRRGTFGGSQVEQEKSTSDTLRAVKPMAPKLSVEQYLAAGKTHLHPTDGTKCSWCSGLAR